MRPRWGFTIIELLVVVIIIGALAAIAVPKVTQTKERAVIASMKADLSNLVMAEEGYLVEFMTYTNDLGSRYQTSPGVTVDLQGVSASGWAATATATGTARTCAVYHGSGATPVAPATLEGAPACD